MIPDIHEVLVTISCLSSLLAERNLNQIAIRHRFCYPASVMNHGGLPLSFYLTVPLLD